MPIVRLKDCRQTPWKNGGGMTTELAISPQTATFEDFDWRISAAHVGTDGPFSHFPGIDRTLALTRGAGMTLAMPGRSAITLTPASQPLAFPGEMPIDATLPGGPADDLNVMTRRGRFAHRMTLREIDGPIELSRGTGLLIVSSRDAALQCEHDGARHRLAPGDLAILDEGEAPLRIVPRGATGLYEIRIGPA